MSGVEHKKCFDGMFPDSLHIDDRSSPEFESCFKLCIGKVALESSGLLINVDAGSSDFLTLNWSDIGRQGMASNGADFVAIESTPNLPCWNMHCSPQYPGRDRRGGPTANQRVSLESRGRLVRAQQVGPIFPNKNR